MGIVMTTAIIASGSPLVTATPYITFAAAAALDFLALNS